MSSVGSQDTRSTLRDQLHFYILQQIIGKLNPKLNTIYNTIVPNKIKYLGIKSNKICTRSVWWKIIKCCERNQRRPKNLER